MRSANSTRCIAPLPLVRAYNSEKRLGTPAKIYYKFEGNNTSGSHKLNSAIAQAYYAKEQGITSLTTETGARPVGHRALHGVRVSSVLTLTVYMVKISSTSRSPTARRLWRPLAPMIIASPSDTTEAGRKILAENPDTTGSLGCAISEAVEQALTTTGLPLCSGQPC